MAGIYSKKLLIIEADRPLSDTLVGRLVSEGFDVYQEHDGAAGLNRIQGLKPDIILLDLELPNTSGMEILQKVHEAGLDPQPLLFLLTPTEQLADVSALQALGVRDHFAKPALNADALAAQISAVVANPNPASTMGLSAYKLLLVEDDKFLRDLAAKKFAHTGIQLLLAVDGEQGLAMAKREHPDVILLDILLPGIDGFTVLESLRKDPDLSTLIIIMLSNFGQREDLERANKLGANRFLVKSNVNLDEIIENVRELIEARQAAHAVA